MSLDRTVKCPHCGELYKQYAFSAADQSACPTCVSKAERSMHKPSERTRGSSWVYPDVFWDAK